jgi:transposase-like protein
MTLKLSDPIFTDAEASRLWMEAQRWPNGPVCPHCGNCDPDRITSLKGKAHRAGLYQCNECREQFTVQVGTVYERSKIPLNKWLLATFLIMSSKKGMSTRQFQRMLGVSLKSTWFMTHRIREALAGGGFVGPLGGEGKTVSVDETYIGGKASNRTYDKRPRKKMAVMTLVDHETGRATSRHLPNVGALEIRDILFTNVSRKSTLVSDESNLYHYSGKAFARHETVIHAGREYVNKDGFSTNRNENFFSLLKRGIYGVYHHVSEAHLHRYVAEFDFRYSTRTLSDTERTALAVKGAEGKRLTYRRTRDATHA